MSDNVSSPLPSPLATAASELHPKRSEAGQRWQPVMRSPMNGLHERLGAQLTVLDGWQIARRYQDMQVEREAIRNGLAVADITARGKIDLRGRLDGELSNLPATEGATLARVSREWALVLTPPAGLSSALEAFTRAAGADAMVTDATSIYAAIALLGPTVDQALLRLISVDPSALTAGGCLATQVLRVPAVLVRPALPVSVVEIYLPSEFGRYAWQALFEVAGSLNPIAVGWDSLAAEDWR